MHGSTRAFACGIQAVDDGFRIAVFRHNHFAQVVRRDAAHHVVGGGNDGNRVFNRVDTGKLNGNLADARQFAHNFFGANVVDFQQNVVFVRTAAAAFVNLHRHSAGNHVARSQIFHGRSIAFHKAFALRVQQDAAFAAHTFGNQHACARHAGRVELPEFHVFQRNAGTRANAQAVAGVHKGIGGGGVNTACTAGGKQNGFGMENVHFASFHFHGGNADNITFFVANQIQCGPFNEKLRVGTDVLLVKRVQHGVAGTVGNGTGAFHGAFAVFCRVAAERALVNFAAFHAVERHTHVLQFNHGFNGVAGHEFDGVLVAQPVRTFHGVVHVPFPVVVLHVAQRCGDAALRRYGMRTSGEYFG